MGYINIYTYIIHKKIYIILYISLKVAICSLWTVCPCLGRDQLLEFYSQLYMMINRDKPNIKLPKNIVADIRSTKAGH